MWLWISKADTIIMVFIPGVNTIVKKNITGLLQRNVVLLSHVELRFYVLNCSLSECCVKSSLYSYFLAV